MRSRARPSSRPSRRPRPRRVAAGLALLAAAVQAACDRPDFARKHLDWPAGGA